MIQYKVLHIIPQLSIGGRERVVYHLIEGLDRSYFSPYLLSLKKSIPRSEYFPLNDFPVTFLGKRERGVDLSLIQKIKKFIVKNEIDIVHTHNPGGFLYGALASKLARTLVTVNTEHGYSYSISRKKRFVEDFLRNRIDMTIAVSQELRKDLCSRSFIRPEKIVVIHNGIDTYKFHTTCVPEDLINEIKKNGKTIVGVIGRLDPIKGHENLLKAFCICLNHNRNIRLIIVGDGPLRCQLKKIADSLCINDEVVFMGNRVDMPQILSVMDIFVLPSLYEGLSITLLEAMAAGKAIIATSVGGNPEVIEDGVTGILTPPNSPPLLARRILELINDPDKREQLGRSARSKADKCFSKDKFVQNIQALYFNCLNKSVKFGSY